MQSGSLEGGNGWYAAGFAQAMAESDRAKTLEFLAGELDGDYARCAAALSSLGIIADPSSLPALRAFREKSKGNTVGNKPYNQMLEHALQRCQGIHRWQLVRDLNGSYSIAK